MTEPAHEETDSESVTAEPAKELTQRRMFLAQKKQLTQHLTLALPS